MTTKLDGALKREINVDGATYTLTITSEGFRLVPKGKRKGYEMVWSAFVSGDAALAQALNASLAASRSPHVDADGGGARHGKT
jgi:hypothetical protein